MRQSNTLKRIITILMGVPAISAVLLFYAPVVHAAPEEEVVENETEAPEEVVVKPTLNAAISDKALTVNAQSEKGISAIYINGYKFANSGNGNLKIKLTQFDAGYEKFYIYAEDTEGVASDIYEVENPYFDTDPKDDNNPAAELPIDASATDPTDAEGTVTEHLYHSGREFYTIETINGKTFYLIVDMLSDEEKVYFLTEISERDLLNATSDQSETLPRNSAIPEEGVPEEGIVITNNNASQSTIETVFGKTEVKEPEVTEKKGFSFGIGSTDVTTDGEAKSSSSAVVYILMGVIGVAVIIIVTVSKKKKRNKKDSLDAEDEENKNE